MSSWDSVAIVHMAKRGWTIAASMEMVHCTQKQSFIISVIIGQQAEIQGIWLVHPIALMWYLENIKRRMKWWDTPHTHVHQEVTVTGHMPSLVPNTHTTRILEAFPSQTARSAKA
jgi:hypothetical protein